MIHTHFQIYKKFRNITANANKSAIKSYFAKLRNDLDNKNLNPKKWWSLTKSVIGCKIHRNIPPLIEDGQVISNILEKAEIFNEYFANQSKLGPNENFPNLPPFEYRTAERLKMFSFKEEEVIKVLLSLRTSSATGPDNIGNFVLKNTASSISNSLVKLFNLSLQSSTFPECWKRSNLCPIFKKSDRQTKSNYRPMSLLCNVSKVLERLVFNKFYEYLIGKGLLTTRNSGFKQNDSTVNQVISILHKIYNGLENHNEARMVFLDVSKAFDRVWHEGLLFKLHQLGFNISLVGWVRSYLSNRL